MGIPRPDAVVRGKITEVIGHLLAEGIIRKTGMYENGGHLYQIVSADASDDAINSEII
jgi:hypothetical protein